MLASRASLAAPQTRSSRNDGESLVVFLCSGTIQIITYALHHEILHRTTACGPCASPIHMCVISPARSVPKERRTWCLCKKSTGSRSVRSPCAGQFDLFKLVRIWRTIGGLMTIGWLTMIDGMTRIGRMTPQERSTNHEDYDEQASIP